MLPYREKKVFIATVNIRINFFALHIFFYNFSNFYFLIKWFYCLVEILHINQMSSLIAHL